MPSSVIRRFRYDEASRTLTITFVSGQRYAYAEVPPDVHRRFVEAFSKGRFFAAHVRDRFAFRRLDDEGGPPDPSARPGPRPSGPASPPHADAARSAG